MNCDDQALLQQLAVLGKLTFQVIVEATCKPDEEKHVTN